MGELPITPPPAVPPAHDCATLLSLDSESGPGPLSGLGPPFRPPSPASARALRPEPARKRRKCISASSGSGDRCHCHQTSHSAPVFPDFVPQDAVSTPFPSARRARATPLSRPRRRVTGSTAVSRFRRQRVTGADVSAAAAAAAATVQNEVTKPREERSLAEFHPDIKLDKPLRVFSVDELNASVFPQRPVNGGGRGSPVKPRLAPIRTAPAPTYSSGDRLKLHKPLFRRVDTFSQFEQDRSVSINYVDRNLASVGYQETDQFSRPLGWYTRQADSLPAGMLDQDPAGDAAIGRVEYDMDMQDVEWLGAVNALRKQANSDPVRPAIFEIAMTLVDREWHEFEKRLPKATTTNAQTVRARSSSATAVKGDSLTLGEDQDSKCAVCDDGDCENLNAIVFCDGCDMAVHQECYGVPFIPEGQWLCRKCQLVGRSGSEDLSCIFCPNTDGAFKQTGNFKWSHLLCALWIPEISLGNTIFMEPVLDVENIPASRWKLNCYICNQKMGACIQCSNKNCFTAFHVTCARKARLYLRMKSAQGNLVFEPSSMISYCDRHGPAGWTREKDVSTALRAAQKHYALAMKDRQWCDSREAALSSNPTSGAGQGDGGPIELGTAFSLSKKKLDQTIKHIWRLPSGAPVIPAVIFDRVETALSRYPIRRRKQFVAEVCKYWTLKRESRRGAALLKRLPAHQSGGTSADLLKRDFLALGSSGLDMLRRRIEFAERVEHDLDMLAQLCERVHKLEEARAEDTLLLQTFVDTLYFPLVPLLGPILKKAAGLDPKQFFLAGFVEMDGRLRSRYYTSVYVFTRDLWSVLCLSIGVRTLAEVLDSKPAPSLAARFPASSGPALTNIQKEKKTFARRIFRAVFPLLQDVLRKETDLVTQPPCGSPISFDGQSCTSPRSGPSAAAPSSPPGTMDGPDGHPLLRIDLNLLDEDDGDLNTGAFAHPGTPHFDLLPPKGHDPGPGQDGGKSRLLPCKQLDVAHLSQPGPDRVPITTEKPQLLSEAHAGLSPFSPGPLGSPVDSKCGRTGQEAAGFGAGGSIAGSALEHQVRTPVSSTLPSKSDHPVASFARAHNVDLGFGGLLPPEANEPVGPLSEGGVPWYLDAFEPDGTTVRFSDSTGSSVGSNRGWEDGN